MYMYWSATKQRVTPEMLMICKIFICARQGPAGTLRGMRAETTCIRRTTAAAAAVIIAVGLTSCGAGDGTTAPSTTQSSTPSNSPTTSAPPTDTGGPNPTVAPTAAPTEDLVRSESDLSTREDVLTGLEEVRTSGYEDRTQVAGGLRFMTEDGTVNCHLGSGGFACLVPEHSEWPADQRADDGLDGMGIPKAIGWSSGGVGGTPFGGVPHHWAVQGQWPSPAESGPLKEGQKIVVSGGGADHPDFTCGVVNNAMTCVSADHGFTVSVDTYTTW